MSNNQHHQAAEGHSLGAMLRHARETAGLSQADLARQLNLGARIVDAMEREDLQTLPSAVYVQGYLRKWAEHLQLDEQQLFQAYARLAGEQRKGDLRHTTPIEPMRLKKVENRTFPWFKILILISIAGALLYSMRFLPESLRLTESIQDAPTQASIGLAVTPLPPSPLPSIPLMPPPEAKPAVAAPAVTPGIIVGEVIAPSPTIAPQATNAPAPNPSTLPLSPAPAQDQATGLELMGQGTAQGSWVRVKDADAKVIFEGTLAPGSRKQLDGKRPFEVTIGSASDIAVTLDGKSIDLKTYARSGGKAFIPKLGTASGP
ncbi:MAG: helix-turn-helix domain-containing protein [Halothiobacillaceae bacterium]